MAVILCRDRFIKIEIRAWMERGFSEGDGVEHSVSARKSKLD